MINPPLNKSNLDPEEFKNFSPVSKQVASQPVQDINENNLNEKLQSA